MRCSQTSSMRWAMTERSITCTGNKRGHQFWQLRVGASCAQLAARHRHQLLPLHVVCSVILSSFPSEPSICLFCLSVCPSVCLSLCILLLIGNHIHIRFDFLCVAITPSMDYLKICDRARCLQNCCPRCGKTV